MSDAGDDSPEEEGNYFKAGVELTAKVPVIYLNPDDLELTVPEAMIYRRAMAQKNPPGNLENHPVLAEISEKISRDAEKVEAMLDEQLPGVTLYDLGEKSYEGLAVNSVLIGPFTRPFHFRGQEYCMVNELRDSYADKNSMLKAMSSVKSDKMIDFPGAVGELILASGIHEGVHCNIEFNRAAGIPTHDRNTPADRLAHEADADQAVIKYLEENGEYKMAQAWKDYRALLAPKHAIYATGIFLDDPAAEIQDVDKYYEAAAQLDTEINNAAAGQLSLDPGEVSQLKETDPHKFIEAVEQAVESGQYDNRPILKEYIENYTGAYKRQILDINEPAETLQVRVSDASVSAISPASDVQAGGDDFSAPTIVAGMTKDNIQIGDEPVADYFASFADPELAQQRLEQEQAQPVSAQPTTTSFSPSLS